MTQVQKNPKKWLYCAGIRALRTCAQCFIALCATNEVVPVYQVDWKYIGGAVLMAGILSLATSLAGLPEVED